MTLTVYYRPFVCFEHQAALKAAQQVLDRGLLRLAERYGYDTVQHRRGDRARFEGASSDGVPTYFEFESVWADAVIAGHRKEKEG